MKITFWGVRGSIACPGADFMRVGGNTSAVELNVAGKTVVFDAGTGLRALGASLQRRRIDRIDMLLSHTHWDHTCGLPFFAPIYDAHAAIRVVAGNAVSRAGGIRAVLASQLTAPHFPVALETMPASLSFVDVTPGETFSIGTAVHVRTAPLSHPGGATGYRVEHAGRSVAYVTDTEHEPGQLDPAIVALIENADVVIYDCTYTDEELGAHRGWGHSTWQQGVRLCRAAGARRLAIFHHDPGHDDEAMDGIARAASRMWSGAFVAIEGMTVAV